jgi:hypothetical protein
MATTPLEEKIIALDAARHQAMIAGDVAALSRLLSDHLTYTHFTGLTESKAEYLASVAKGVFGTGASRSRSGRSARPQAPCSSP